MQNFINLSPSARFPPCSKYSYPANKDVLYSSKRPLSPARNVGVALQIVI